MSIVDLIDRDLVLGKRYIRLLELRAPSLYHSFRVDGRKIMAPDPELKLVQCWIGDFVRAETPGLPHYVSAYESGRSVRDNALMHAPHEHLLTLDIRGFFRSCSQEMVKNFFASMWIGKREEVLSADDIRFLAALACYKGALVMGSPSSPFIANRIMLPIDARIISLLPSGYSYSRYSDDISISSNDRIDKRELVNVVSDALAAYGFTLNVGKTHCLGRGDARRVTGVFVTPDGRLSIGAKRKKELCSSLYRVLMSCEDDPEIALYARSVVGMINFCKEIEPEYLNGLLAKYSSYGLAVKSGGVMPALARLTN